MTGIHDGGRATRLGETAITPPPAACPAGRTAPEPSAISKLFSALRPRHRSRDFTRAQMDVQNLS